MPQDSIFYQALLTLFDMGGMMAPKMFLTTVPKRSEREN